MKAIGIKQDGKKMTFRSGDTVRCIYCQDKELKELHIFRGTISVACQGNLLTSIDMPKGLVSLRCDDNQLTELKYPISLSWLSCDKELFDYNTCKINVVNILYR